ncbi:MAG: formylglycine-generating enzyme family protein [Clostridiales bacterium]|nr:formylglycine-generating enzyme family protein [Clostridiales bacterium]
MDKYAPIISAINKRQLVVVLGLPIGTGDEQYITQKYICDKLKNELSISKDISYEEVIDVYIKMHKKEALINKLDILSRTKNEIPYYFDELLTIHPKCIIETHPFSQWIQYIYSKGVDAGVCENRGFGEDFDAINTEQVCLSYFGGFISSNREGILLASNEIQDRFNAKGSLSISFQSLLRNQIIFIGFNPADKGFKRLYDNFCRKNGEYPNQAFLLTDDTYSDSYSVYGEAENLVVLNGIKNILTDIVSEVERQRMLIEIESNPKGDLVRKSPYKYLNSFEEGDADIFFGREQEIDELYTRVVATNQILVVSAMSGYGKTSLINAGLIPQLKSRGDCDVFYVRCLSNPWNELVQLVFKCDVADGKVLSNTFSNKQFQFIIIDQFEEVFTNDEEDAIETFKKNITNFLQVNPNTKIVISIREDFYPALLKTELFAHLSSNNYFLSPLKQKNAIEAIVEPAKKMGFIFEDGLPNKIVCDLQANLVGEDSSGIDPSQLQIVCDKLYQETVLKKESIITAELYNNLGGAEAILTSYIDDSLRVFSGNEDYLICAQEILKAMVTSKRTRKPITKDELITSFNDAELIINNLVDARLIRRLSGGAGESYELTHEYIIKKISLWMDEETLEVNKTKELLESELTRWQNFKELKNYIHNDEMLLLLNKHREKINHNDETNAFVLASLINAGRLESMQVEDACYWFVSCRNNNILSDFLKPIITEQRGYAKNFALFSLLVLLDSKVVPKEYYYIINPHIKAARDYILSLGVFIDSALLSDINRVLEENRTKNMVTIPPCAASLGLPIDQVKSIMKKNDIPNRLRPFFPDKERKVQLRKFLIDKYLVTNKEYAEFDDTYTYDLECGDFPVVGISYDKALAFALWWDKTIPSEDQWEYAARGNGGYYFPWGDEWDPESEKKLDEDSKKCNTSLTGTDGLAPVNKYENGKSHFGCYNMAGMVWEWTSTPATITGKATQKIVKGGSWSLMGISPWMWYRFNYDGNKSFMNVGFRCVINE